MAGKLAQRAACTSHQRRTKKRHYRQNDGNALIYMVGAKGFEPSTSCSQSRCATRLRHAPKKNPRRCGAGKLWGERWDLNPRPPGPQPGALPTELLPPRKNSYKQVILIWQAFFPHSFIWILSRKISTLGAAVWHSGKISAHLAICLPHRLCAACLLWEQGACIGVKHFFGDTHGQTGY